MTAKLTAIVVLACAVHFMLPAAVLAQESGHAISQAELEKIVPPELYTQNGFKATGHAREFANWKRRFVSDRRALLERLNEVERDATLNTEDKKSLIASIRTSAFTNSIDNGKKGQSLVNFMIDDRLAAATYVARPGITVARLMDNEDCRAVGFGGTLELNGVTVELWYVVFNDMSKMRYKDLRTTSAFSVFEPLRLPKLNEVKRNSWPSMIFIRDADGRLMLWAMSEEQYRIVMRTQEKSMY